ncbi:hypothetical protein ANN_03192 [Periplaneta americana]|uniref:Uncharacterized protein n=1 Tax=Periplaneta americana TaxID=6978 RepID=A0ABQ8TYB7_PERAM|nr:hypothetical protein ANN_03192 [Periplaneta americana]
MLGAGDRTELRRLEAFLTERPQISEVSTAGHGRLGNLRSGVRRSQTAIHRMPSIVTEPFDSAAAADRQSLEDTRFALEHVNWHLQHWWQVLFTDESRFSLTFCVERLRVWRRRGERLEEPKILENDKFVWDSVMVLASNSLETKTALTVVPGRLNAIGYVENILRQYVLSVMESMGFGLVLMHDYVRAHVAAVSMNFVNEHEIPVMD